MKSIKARINLGIDLVIGLAFLVEAVTGFVLAVVLPHGGYQGGRNVVYGDTFLLARGDWLLLHDWFAIAMALGVLAHIVLHWRWIVCMAQKTWRDAWARDESQVGQECPV